jgi:hypothetical protein
MTLLPLKSGDDGFQMENLEQSPDDARRVTCGMTARGFGTLMQSELVWNNEKPGIAVANSG